MITLMPAMFREKWSDIFKNSSLVKIFNEQIQNIVRFYIVRKRQSRPFRFCINECLTAQLSNFIISSQSGLFPFCGAGVNKLGISLSGKIYPCYLFAASPNFRENEAFCLGDIFNGFRSIQEINKSYNYFKENKYFSCLYWNIVENNEPHKPAYIYRILYRSILHAINDYCQLR